MTIKEAIENDTVGVRWIRTAATTVVSLSAAIGILWTATVYLVEPRISEYLSAFVTETTEEMRSQVKSTTENLNKLTVLVDQLSDTVAVVQEGQALLEAPAFRWSVPDTTVSDGAIGGRVNIAATGYKLRECGPPVVDMYFVNGDQVFHRFEDLSVTDSNNRGIALPVRPEMPQIVNFTAVIPADDNVKPGRAQAYITLTYPDLCPNATAVTVGPMQFRIFPERQNTP